MSHLRMNFLFSNRIITRRYPVLDKPTHVFDWGWFYENGTYEYYSLFSYEKSIIRSYRSLKWHLLVIRYLNDNLENKMFEKIAKHISKKKNGFTTFDIDDSSFIRIMNEILNHDFEFAPKNKRRKVIFKDGCGLTKSQKLSITGKLIGRKNSVNNSDLYEIMLYIHDTSEKITIKKLAKALNVSSRTIHRNMDLNLKTEKNLLNEELQRRKLCAL